MKPEEQRTEKQRGKKPKKPYRKPACVSEQIFETTALACGKQPGRGGACIGAPKAS